MKKKNEEEDTSRRQAMRRWERNNMVGIKGTNNGAEEKRAKVPATGK